MFFKQFSSSYAFYDLDYLRWSILRGSAQEVVDMIMIYSYLLKLNDVTLFDFFTYLIDDLLAVRTSENCFAILYWCYKVYNGFDRRYVQTS